ncbi:hypothetical protein [uncultured Hymenobacter sp.]|uniref:hypothetical protein n=1 Tax=uncultured Hymenobacter sp. TaxID=170016 RepID=UPI0035C98BFF
MLRYLLVAALLLAGLTEASAQTTTRRKTAKKRAAYSVRGPRRAVGPGISPRTGRPYGEALAQHPELKDQVYLAPGVPMRKRSTYLPKSSYSNRAPRAAALGAATTRNANTTLNGGTKSAAPAKARRRP